jgi:hypothetical protein
MLSVARQVGGVLLLTALLAMIMVRSSGLRSTAAGDGVYLGPFADLGALTTLGPIGLVALVLTALAVATAGIARFLGSGGR